MSLKDKLLKTGSKLTKIIEDSEVFSVKEFISTPVPIINTLLSGDPFGGISPGSTIWSGPSKHFKTMFCLLCAKSFLDKYDDGLIVFYDSEFGTPPNYFKSLGIDTSRIIHIPIENFEELKFDMPQKLEQIEEGDHVMFIIDSLGNLASKKEADDAMNEKSVGDMTRAKENKSFFRIITPKLKKKKISLHAIQHVYDSMGMFPTKVVAGGTGAMYSSDNVYIIGRQQDKDGTEISGYNFIINVEKSRFVKEKSKVSVNVKYEGGINRWSGLLDLALEGGFVTKLNTQSYCLIDNETGEVLEDVKYKRKDIEFNSNLWQNMLKNEKFIQFIKDKYRISTNNLIDEIEE